MDEEGSFVMIVEDVSIPSQASEFANNVSNRRHWPILRYVDGCLAGAEAPRGHDYQRWVASLVAETWRIISRRRLSLSGRCPQGL